MFNTLLTMLYLYFRLIYLFHVIQSSCLSSGLVHNNLPIENLYIEFIREKIRHTQTFPKNEKNEGTLQNQLYSGSYQVTSSIAEV